MLPRAVGKTLRAAALACLVLAAFAAIGAAADAPAPAPAGAKAQQASQGPVAPSISPVQPPELSAVPNSAASPPEKAAGNGKAARKEAAQPDASGPPPPAAQGVPEGKEQALLRRGIARIELAPSRPLLLSAPFEGVLLSIPVHDGDTVAAGQAVAVLDAGELELRLEEARFFLKAVAERLEKAQDAPVAELEQAAALAASANTAVKRLEGQLARTTLEAPFNGRVTAVLAQAGQKLKQGDAIAELAEEGDLEIVGTVPSAWIARLAPGHLIWVYVDEAGKSYEAEIVRIAGKVDPTTRSVRAYSRFLSLPPELLPGMSGRADYFPKRSR